MNTHTKTNWKPITTIASTTLCAILGACGSGPDQGEGVATTLTVTDLVRTLQDDDKVNAALAALEEQGCHLFIAEDGFTDSYEADPVLGFLGVYMVAGPCDEGNKNAMLHVALAPDARVVAVAASSAYTEGTTNGVPTKTSVVGLTVDVSGVVEQHEGLSAFEIAWTQIVEEAYAPIVGASATPLMVSDLGMQATALTPSSQIAIDPNRPGLNQGGWSSYEGECDGSCAECMAWHATNKGDGQMREMVSDLICGTGAVAAAGVIGVAVAAPVCAATLGLGCVIALVAIPAMIPAFLVCDAVVTPGAAPTDQEWCSQTCGAGVCVAPECLTDADCTADRMLPALQDGFEDDGVTPKYVDGTCSNTGDAWLCQK